MNCRTDVLRPGRRAATVALVVLLASVAIVSANDQVPAPVQDRPILLRGGDLYTIANGVLAGTDLLFDEGRIQAIGRGLTAPEGADEVDVTGLRVYPGFIAPQTTIGLTEIGAVAATNDTREKGDVTPEVVASVAYNPDSEIIPTVRAHGITTAQVTPSGALVAGRPSVLHLDGWTREDTAVLPVHGLQVSWPSAAVSTAWWVRTSREEQLKQMSRRRVELREAFEVAISYHEARATGADVSFDLRLEAMRAAVSGEEPLYVVANDYRQIVEALAFAAELDLDLVLVGGREAYKLTDLLVARDVPVILGSTLSTPMRGGDGYDTPFRQPAMLAEAGVRFAFSGAGSWPTRNLPFQAAQAVAFGLPEAAALRALTLSTAEILGIDEQLGSLEVGKSATLFVSRGDALDLLTQDVVRMYIDGREVDLDNRHRQLYRKYSQRLQTQSR